MPLWKNGTFIEDAWQVVADDAPVPADAAVVLSLKRWRAERDTLAARNAPIALQIDPGNDWQDIVEDLPRFPVIVVTIPKFADGRAFSIARLLRERDGETGESRVMGAYIIDQVPFGRIYKDGKLIGRDKAVGIKERRKLSFAGHVAVNVVLDDGYEMAGDPDLEAIGLPETDAAGEPFDDLLIDAAAGAVDSIPRQRRKDLDLVEDAVRRAVRAAANDACGKKPMVTVFVTRGTNRE